MTASNLPSCNSWLFIPCFYLVEPSRCSTYNGVHPIKPIVNWKILLRWKYIWFTYTTSQLSLATWSVLRTLTLAYSWAKAPHTERIYNTLLNSSCDVLNTEKPAAWVLEALFPVNVLFLHHGKVRQSCKVNHWRSWTVSVWAYRC